MNIKEIEQQIQNNLDKINAIKNETIQSLSKENDKLYLELFKLKFLQNSVWILKDSDYSDNLELISICSKNSTNLLDFSPNNFEIEDNVFIDAEENINEISFETSYYISFRFKSFNNFLTFAKKYNLKIEVSKELRAFIKNKIDFHSKLLYLNILIDPRQSLSQEEFDDLPQISQKDLQNIRSK